MDIAAISHQQRSDQPSAVSEEALDAVNLYGSLKGFSERKNRLIADGYFPRFPR